MSAAAAQVREGGPGGAFLLFTERAGLMRTLPFAALAAGAPAASLPLLVGVQPGAGPQPQSAAALPEPRPFDMQHAKGGHLATMHYAMR